MQIRQMEGDVSISFVDVVCKCENIVQGYDLFILFGHLFVDGLLSTFEVWCLLFSILRSRTQKRIEYHDH